MEAYKILRLDNVLIFNIIPLEIIISFSVEGKLFLVKPHPIDRTLTVFPQLYFFVPPISNKIDIEGESVRISDPDDAILWLAQVLANDKQLKYCLQNELRALIRRWRPKMTPGLFSQRLARLEAQGYIQRVRYEKNRTTNTVKLTPKGHILLEGIKTERRKILKSLFQGLKPSEMNQLATQLEAVGMRTWLTMKDESLISVS